MDERTIGSERREALGEATKLLDLAISRQAEDTRDPEWMTEQARRFIDAGAFMIVIESEGITENADPWRTDVPAEVINSLGLENVNFEAAVPEVFAWYVKNYVPEVNLFVDHSQIVQLETLRRGIWGRVLTYKG